MQIGNCEFCSELTGSADNAFAEIYNGNPERRFLFRSRQFAVVPSLGQIVEGYLLVLPIEHFRTIGDMPDDLLTEFGGVCRRAGQILKNQYGQYVLFEHGARADGAGGCGIYHAHVHATPLAGLSDPVDVLKGRFPYTVLRNLNEIREESVGLPSYLLYQDSGAGLYLFDTGPLPSQYMRKLLADAIGGQEWNWRNAGREDRLLATIERLAPRFKRADQAIQEK
jgi:diadenosine tetraphosphate (Ap4A) HIT family hydrolase